ncbi:MAG: Rrf2 family transcriptional regulator [Verrucomicrobiota bacterium]
MHISRAVEYGVLGLMALARRPIGAVVMIDEVSREEDIPKSFLAKIFQSLAKAGLVRSVRGTGGGFALTKTPEEITILDVIQAVEGPIALQRCLDVNSSCVHTESCALCSIFAVAQDRLKETFAATSLATLARQQAVMPMANRRGKAIPVMAEA